jgi:immunity protein 5 of polymorphic toxin system
MKKYDRPDQRLMAAWAADCAERVLPFFEKANPKDDRPRKAIEACRTWVRTGLFRMADIRGASLGAHAAAREAKEDDPACFAARAAGQAVATAHVPQHAFGAAYYALKAIGAADPAHAGVKVAKERNWQARHIPAKLRQEFLKRVIVQRRGGGFLVQVQKDKDY